MDLNNLLLIIIQSTSILTFIIFMIFVYIPKSINKKNGLKKDFIQNKKITKDFIILTLFYAFIFSHLFYFTTPTYWLTYWVGFLAAMIGVIIATIGRLKLRKLWNPLTNIYNSKEVLDKGIFGKIRHPIYLGRMFFASGLFLMFNLWGILLLPLYWNYLRDKLIQEEEYLSKVNPKYKTYMKKVKRIIF